MSDDPKIEIGDFDHPARAGEYWLVPSCEVCDRRCSSRMPHPSATVLDRGMNRTRPALSCTKCVDRARRGERPKRTAKEPASQSLDLFSGLGERK